MFQKQICTKTALLIGLAAVLGPSCSREPMPSQGVSNAESEQIDLVASYKPIDSVFDQIVLGLGQSKSIFFEVPITDSLWGQSPQNAGGKYLRSVGPEEGDERSRLDGQFFSRLISASTAHPARYIEDPIDYWGRRVAPDSIDSAFLRRAIDYRIGDVLNILASTGKGQARVTDVQVRCNEIDERCAVLAVASATTVQVQDGMLVLASRLPFPCDPCHVRRTDQIHRTPVDAIWKVALANGWVEGGVSEIIELTGRFVPSNEQQRVALIRGMADGIWTTMILDSSLSVIHVLGSNSYLEIEPIATSDINVDGIEEIWVHLQGLEGFSDGIIYFSGSTAQIPFTLVRTFLNGA
jgi:hypothetical protein